MFNLFINDLDDGYGTLSASLLMIENRQEWLIDQMIVPPLQLSLHRCVTWVMKLTVGIAKTCTWGGMTPGNSWWVAVWKAGLQRRTLGVLVEHKLNISQHCVLEVKKANGLLGCIQRSAISRWKEVILPLSPGERHLKCWVQSWAPQDNYVLSLSRGDINILE